MKEACPRCGAVQIRYQGKVYCTNEDDISYILSPAAPKREPPSPAVKPGASQPVPSTAASKLSEIGAESERDALKALLEEKLAKVTKELDSSQDLDQQAKLLDLISKYLETLQKLKGSSSSA